MKIKLANTPAIPPVEIKKDAIKKEMKSMIAEIGELLYQMQAQSKYSILVVLQGMDASGKDGIVNKIFRKTSPNGVSVAAFKKPTELEFAHDFLWRIHQKIPRKGMLTVFNRSHYEDILVPSVYKYIDKKVIDDRYEHINNFERLIEANGTRILKFYLNVSPEKQLKRLHERINIREKNWKHNDNDFKAVEDREQFISVYEEIFERCNEVPWTIVPADHNWYKAFVVAKSVLDTLKAMDLEWPGLDSEIYGK